MILLDVNVLIYAFRTESARHKEYKAWLEETTAGPAACGFSDLVLSAFLRIVTHPRILQPPTPLPKALEFVQGLRDRPNSVRLAPGPRHWELFTELCGQAGATGNLVADAYHAALALESGSEWITTDRDYARFPGLKWRHPLEPAR
jgi:hypothetical protein